MAGPHPFVIVGAGVGGSSAAAQLRKEGSDAPILLLGAEAEPPYDRPPLSKEYLRGEADAGAIGLRSPSFYDEQSIELRTSSRVVAIDPAERSVTLESGERIAFERLLLATGASPHHLDVPGSGLAGVHYLRTREDADAIREAALAGSRAVVAGGGWIGSEVAASLRQLGLEVTLVVSGRQPLERVLGPEVGAIYAALHGDHGVELVTGRRVTAIHGSAQVTAVELSDGTRRAADVLVVGIGVQPRILLASDAGLRVDDGVLVDEHLETSAPGIFAVGDIAAAWHPWLAMRIRVEHRENAARQGRSVARSMLGQPEAYARLPYFYSDQFDLSMEYVGHALSWDAVVLRGDVEQRRFVALWLRGGRVVAGMNANVPHVNAAIADLIHARRTMDPDRLRDPDIPLDEVEVLALAKADSSAETPTGVPAARG